jgi:hypothetical protein
VQDPVSHEVTKLQLLDPEEDADRVNAKLAMLIREHVTTIVRVTTGSDLITADLSKRATEGTLIGFFVHQSA